MSDLWTNSTPLNNQDFRKLLSTPRPHDATPRQPQSQRGGSKQQQHSKPKASSSSAGGKEHKFKKPAPKGSAKAGADEDDDGPKYRDRAEERRQDANPDYLLSSAELAARSGGSVAGGAVTADSVAGLSIEDSKFLGGDLEHTHLVKGLDYALLHQQRMRLKQAEAEGGSRGLDGPSAAAARAIRKEDVKFAGPLGRAVFDALFQPPRRDVRSLFQPRRMAFVYDFDAESEEGGTIFASDVPTTLQRSKADCPPVRDALNATADAVVLERIAKIMSYIQVNATGKGSGSAAGKKAHGASTEKHSDFIRNILAGSDKEMPSGSQVQGQVLVKNQAALAAAAAHQQQQDQQQQQGGGAAAVDDDDDIFGEAGTDYVPELPERGKAKGETSGRAGGYFDRKDDMADLPPPPPMLPADASAEADMDIEQQGWQQQQQQQGGSSELWRAPRDNAAGTKLKGFAEEAYAECFPEIVMGGEVVGSDDEGEVVTDGKKLGRGDFKTDEEWEAHQAGTAKGAKGPAAKGAASAKGGPNRKERRAGAKTVEENKRDQKLDNELGKIEKLFEEKGFGNEGAFAKPAAIESEGKGSGKGKGRGGGSRAVQEEATPGPAKRRRMDL